MKLSELNNAILTCTRCGLCHTRTHAVPGEGKYTKKVLFVGEAPGEKEDLQGVPFVGNAGKFLTKLLARIGLEREDIYITNIVKCRPPSNRNPTAEEIALCSPYFNMQLKFFKPLIICSLGNFSTKYLLNKFNLAEQGISKLHGTPIFLEHLNAHLMPLYHPAAALHNPNLRHILEEDFDKLHTLLENAKTH